MEGSLNITEASAMLDKFTYKPDWRMEIIQQSSYPELTLQTVFKAVDTYHPGRTVEVVSQCPLPDRINDEKEFSNWLREAIRRQEIHEMDEWFKYKETGKPINNPHARDF